MKCDFNGKHVHCGNCHAAVGIEQARAISKAKLPCSSCGITEEEWLAKDREQAKAEAAQIVDALRKAFGDGFASAELVNLQTGERIDMTAPEKRLN